MRNRKLLRTGLISLSVTAALALLFYWALSGNEKHAGPVNPAFGEYVSSYTAGVVSSGSSIRIVFARDVVDSSSVGQEPSHNLFKFSPSIDGVVRWLDRRTVEFKPAKRMVAGQTYDVTVFLSRFLEVPRELGNFEYSFQVIPQNFDLTVENIKPYVKTQLARLKIEGTLTTSDFAEATAVEKVLTARQKDKAMKISWTHNAEGKQHMFVVEDVVREDSSGHLKLVTHGSALGVSQSGERDVEIPALGDFKVMSVQVDQNGGQRIVVQFSDPLDERQNLEGLISVANAANLDFEIKDNQISIYPPVRQTGTQTLRIEPGIRNILNYRMAKSAVLDVVFEQLKPEVRFTGKGSILPGTNGLVLPFEAVSLKSVDLEVIKIFETNILQFLQVNDIDGNAELRRVGIPVLRKNIVLDNAGVSDLGKWNRFTLDLATLMGTEPGAIYQVRLGFKKNNAVYVCDGQESVAPAASADEDWSEGNGEQSNWDSYEESYYGEGYDWEQRDNPCNVSYYSGKRNIKRNVIASDLGLIAKRGSDGTTLVIVNDLRTTQPMSGVQLELYDYQQQRIGSAATDAEGKATLTSNKIPFALVAKNGSQRGYLKLEDGSSLSLSNFNTGGEQIRKGLKGFLYGERGVWRPGDSLYLSFILEDKLKTLPPNDPVVFELANPQGQITTRAVKSGSLQGFYKFTTATSADAPTGNWTVRAKVGGVEFTQPVRIETVKPNRLKINLNFGVDRLTTGPIKGNLNVRWLQGTPGKNLKAQFEAILVKGETTFDKYPGFVFDDPSRDFTSESQSVFEGVTDAQGNATVATTLHVSDAAPGMLTAVFRGKVFEEGGNFSIDRFSIPYYPYTSFTGIRVPTGDKARGMLLTDTTHRVDVAVVDADGRPLSRENVEVSLYKIKWHWWWDKENGDKVNFMNGDDAAPVQAGKVRVVNGKGVWNFKVKYPEWGRYFVRAYDPVSGHSTGKIIYIDWPGWAGRSRAGNAGVSMLTFSSDKPVYAVGEKVALTIPGSDQGRALISIENGSRVVETFWLSTNKGDNSFSFEATREMTPNIFVHITLLQPHSQTTNDLPIRLYGVIPLRMEDPATHLMPVITMADAVEPGQEVSIRVSENSNRAMTYTLAVVEEGLLDLTKYKTPDPWNRFYAREALGVRTWDVYDQVMGAFGGKIERLLAIGGDGEIAGKEGGQKTNRFKPVVKFFGPFSINGGTREHRFIMPEYIGSVKAMVVAGNDGAYGSVEKAVPVKKPLMVLATLPRVLGPQETVKLPITIFTTDPGIHNVNVNVHVTGPVALTGGSSRQVVVESGDKTVEFDLTVKGEAGTARIEVTATAGAINATDAIDIAVRNPNLPVTNVVSSIIEAGKTWNGRFEPVGVAGTNSAILEVSSLPPINLGQRLGYLMKYPYGCIEQTTSSVFPQLYLGRLKALSESEKSSVQNNIRAGIERLKLFVTHDGGFSYWPGQEDADAWGTTYAGHFLVEAESLGYFVPEDMIQRWKAHERRRTQEWRRSREYPNGSLVQVYRLYALALAGAADLGAMNRLREQGDLPVTAMWMLAAAYGKAGQPEAAKKLIANLPVEVKPYQEMGDTYGSDLRDKAIILETMLLLGDRTNAFQQVRDISEKISNPNAWLSTQTIAWCLKAVGMFAGAGQKNDLRFSYTFKGKTVQVQTGFPMAQVPLPVEGIKSEALTFVSEAHATLFVRLIGEGVPAQGTEDDAAQNLNLTIAYTDTKGTPIDPTTLEQGTSFFASVVVTNPGLRGDYKNLALKQVFPSGWEINNLRLEEAESRLGGDKPTYQDIRDDRVYTYFDLNAYQRKEFRVLLTASYAGTFYLPAVMAEAMYDHSAFARRRGQEVRVVKSKVP